MPRPPPCALSCLTSSPPSLPHSVAAGRTGPVLSLGLSSLAGVLLQPASLDFPAFPVSVQSLLLSYFANFSLGCLSSAMAPASQASSPWPLPLPPWLGIFDSQYSVFKVRRLFRPLTVLPAMKRQNLFRFLIADNASMDFNLAAACSPMPSPAQYHRPLTS